MAVISSVWGTVFPATPWQGLEWAILESPACTKLARIEGGATFAPEEFPRGLAFGEGREVRWQKLRKGGFRVVMVDEEGAGLDANTARPLEEMHSEIVRLWGEPRNGYWHEARIPREIRYPAEFGGASLGVEVVHYEMRRPEGPVFLYRCKRLVRA